MRASLAGVEPVRGPAGRPDFAEVAHAELDGVYRYLLQLTRDPPLAEDLTSATFERALRDWRRYDPARGRPRVWLVEIARRQALDHFRRERRRRAREERAARPEGHDGGVGAASGLPPEVRAAMDSLSETERELIALRVLLDVDTGETARIMGMSPTAVSSALHRALGRLRRRIEAGEGEPA